MDPSRKQARLTFRSVPAQLLGEEGGAVAGFARTLDQAAAGLASEMAGGAERLLDQAIDYAVIREQYRPPNGAVHQLQHKAADIDQKRVVVGMNLSVSVTIRGSHNINTKN